MYLYKKTKMKNISKKGLESVGGQAVMEGVMMKSAHFYSVSVRKKDGSIKTKTERFISVFEKFPKLKKPIMRGVISLFEMMILGIKTIIYSANETQETEEEKLTKLQTVWLLIVSISMSVALFVLLPLGLTYLLKLVIDIVDKSSLVFNLVDGVIKIFVFLSYIYIVALFPDIRRVFQYHGAEHKSIYTFENNQELIVKNAKPYTTLHPRCGTSFLVFVMVISVLIFSIVPIDLPFYINFFWRVPLIPLIAGIGYEVLKWSARHQNNFWIKLIIWPGLQVQRLTTKKPTDKQLEVGLESLKAVCEAEREYQKEGTKA